ncbi:MAG: hypothetical protein AAF215_02790 [Cyanobacteria bacterium P01_A01_bin.123]
MSTTNPDTPPPAANAKRYALKELKAFERSPFQGVWPHLDKQEILEDMRSRLHNPFNVNQGQQPFCGPASILFELVRKQPLRYVQMCRKLFEMGGFQAKTEWIQTSEALRQASQGNLRMGQADWMVLSTLRESENRIFPVEPNAPEVVRNLAGMTKSWEMKGWIREILGYDNVTYRHTYLLGDLSAMKQAQAAIDAGGVAFGLITAEGMLNDTQKPSLALPNHWIVLLGDVEITKGTFGRHDSGSISFDLYTWAQKRHIEMAEGPFEDNFWGVVIGQP